MSTRCRPIRRWTVSIAAGICVSLWSGIASAQDDAFVRQRDAEAAKNQSSGFSVSFADGRRTFHPGETIKLLFTFRRYDISPYNYEQCSGLGIADAVLDRSDGTADPQADLWSNGVISPACGVLSGVAGGVADGMEPSPIEFAVYLNQGVRFDRPGKYRFYVRSHHRFHQRDGRPPPLISNMLELEIVDRDEAWETSTLEQSLGVVDSSTDAAARRDAARAIAFLGSDRAIDEMARRYDRIAPWLEGPPDPDGGALDAYWLRGLYGARERPRVVAQMAQQLDRAERFVSPRFVANLALLELTGQTDERPLDHSAYQSRLHSYGSRHLMVLKAAGRLPEHLRQRIAFALTYAFPHQLASLDLTHAYADVPDDVETAFATLTPVQQRTLLTAEHNWVVLHDRAFVPMLRRMTSGTDRRGPQEIALRLLYDLAPDEGRRIAMRELAKPASTIGILGLGILPDAELAQFDKSFARALEEASTLQEYGDALDRIERFGSGHIFNRVQRAYERFTGARTCNLGPTALAYFFRVAPAYARAQVEEVVEEVSAGERCDTGVLPAIAERRLTPAVEETAISYLGDLEGWVVADAARMLREHGTARAEGALWQALERWHDRWKDRAEAVETNRRNPNGVPWEEAIEGDLRMALMAGAGWLMNEPSARRLTSLCLTSDCRTAVEQELRTPEGHPRILVTAPVLPGGEATVVAHDRTLVALLSRDALHGWLGLHPEGTTFVWQEAPRLGLEDGWLPGEAERYLEDTRTFVESRGMTLVRDR